MVAGLMMRTGVRSSVAFARRAQLLRVPLRPPAVVSSLPAAAVIMVLLRHAHERYITSDLYHD